jgi:3-phenylpropionate/cinnamic acid dioxygenase small subunit
VEEDDDGMSTATLTQAITLDEATRFIWAEADMLDRLDYKSWLPLWVEDGRYTIPVEHDADDFENQLNVAHDDAEMRAARVKRLLSGFSMSAAPPRARCVPSRASS